MDLIQFKHSPQLDTFLSKKITTPRYQPQVTTKLSSTLFAELEGFVGYKLSATDVRDVADILASNTGECKYELFISSLQYFTQYPLSKVFLKFICDQVSAARSSLKRNMPFDIFKGAQGFEWAPFKVTDVLQDVDTYQQHVLCMFTDGRPCGITFDLLQKSIGYKFYRGAGLSKKALKGVQLSPKDLVGFKYTALLQYKPTFPLDFVNRCVKRLDTDAIAAVRCTSAQAQSNKTLHKERQTPCPLKLSNTCAQCFIGYDHCPRGCRTFTNWAITNNPPAEILINGQRN